MKRVGSSVEDIVALLGVYLFSLYGFDLEHLYYILYFTYKMLCIRKTMLCIRKTKKTLVNAGLQFVCLMTLPRLMVNNNHFSEYSADVFPSQHCVLRK